MADVKIRRLERWVLETHRARAEAAGRSLEEEELRRLVTEAASRPPHHFARRAVKLRAELKRKYGSRPDSTPLIREDRDLRG